MNEESKKNIEKVLEETAGMPPAGIKELLYIFEGYRLGLSAAQNAQTEKRPA